MRFSEWRLCIVGSKTSKKPAEAGGDPAKRAAWRSYPQLLTTPHRDRLLRDIIVRKLYIYIYIYIVHIANEYMDKLHLYISRVTEHNTDHNIVCKLFPLIKPLHPGVANSAVAN
jgi:hypothetical protein